MELFAQIKGKSSRECELVFATVSSKDCEPDRTKVLSSTMTQITFCADTELIKLLQEVKVVLSNINPNPTYSELLKIVFKKAMGHLRGETKILKPRSRRADLDRSVETVVLMTESKGEDITSDGMDIKERIEKSPIKEKVSRSSRSNDQKSSFTVASSAPMFRHESNNNADPNFKYKANKLPGRVHIGAEITNVRHEGLENLAYEYAPISTRIRKHILERDRYCCTYQNSATGHKCDSKHRLHVDHIVPQALGGSNRPENLQTLCQAHNLYFAVKVFGTEETFGTEKVS